MKKLINTFDCKYAQLQSRSEELVSKVRSDRLFWKPSDLIGIYSFGEYILRSAGRVEQTFGGITTRLWDDPFEWTLPEELSTKKKIFEYFSEVEATRKLGFAFFKSDEDLMKEIPAPEQMKPIFDVLLDTLIDASILQSRALSALDAKENKIK